MAADMWPNVAWPDIPTHLQITEEIKGCLDFLDHVYGVFGFTYKLYLSTRPEKFMGDPAMWDKAEAVS